MKYFLIAFACLFLNAQVIQADNVYSKSFNLSQAEVTRISRNGEESGLGAPFSHLVFVAKVPLSNGQIEIHSLQYQDEPNELRPELFNDLMKKPLADLAFYTVTIRCSNPIPTTQSGNMTIYLYRLHNSFHDCRVLINMEKAQL